MAVISDLVSDLASAGGNLLGVNSDAQPGEFPGLLGVVKGIAPAVRPIVSLGGGISDAIDRVYGRGTDHNMRGFKLLDEIWDPTAQAYGAIHNNVLAPMFGFGPTAETQSQVQVVDNPISPRTDLTLEELAFINDAEENPERYSLEELGQMGLIGDEEANEESIVTEDPPELYPEGSTFYPLGRDPESAGFDVDFYGNEMLGSPVESRPEQDEDEADDLEEGDTPLADPLINENNREIASEEKPRTFLTVGPSGQGENKLVPKLQGSLTPEEEEVRRIISHPTFPLKVIRMDGTIGGRHGGFEHGFIHYIDSEGKRQRMRIDDAARVWNDPKYPWSASTLPIDLDLSDAAETGLDIISNQNPIFSSLSDGIEAVYNEGMQQMESLSPEMIDDALSAIMAGDLETAEAILGQTPEGQEILNQAEVTSSMEGMQPVNDMQLDR